MRSTISSLRVHHIVEYIKLVGLPLETHEVEDLGAVAVLSECMGINMQLSPDEHTLLQEELIKLAEQNEICEAQAKLKELFPEDCGEMLVRQVSSDSAQSATTYSLPFAYPVDSNLRALRPGASFPFYVKEAP